MLYAVSHSSTSIRPFAVRDSPRPSQSFPDDLREFISSRPSQGNVELKMLNVQSIPAGEASFFLVRDRFDPYHTFIEDLREFICLCLDRVDPHRESEEYRRLQERASRLHERLLAMLPEEGRAMLMEYGEAVGDAHCLEVMILAERAFLDGMRLVVRAMGT